MATSPRGHRFQALAQLVDFNGQARQRQSLVATEAVLLDQSAATRGDGTRSTCPCQCERRSS
jgi:hypothetical protein